MKHKNIHPEAKQLLYDYGNRIHQKRKKAKLTLIQAEELLNIDISRLSRIERGLINLTINEIYSLDAEFDKILLKNSKIR